MLAAKPDAIAHAEEFLYSPVIDGDDEKIVAGMKSGGISLITTLICYDTSRGRSPISTALLARCEAGYVNPVLRRMWARPRNQYLGRFTPARIPNLRRLLGFQKQLSRSSMRAAFRSSRGPMPAARRSSSREPLVG